jgi:isoleucyl-tRNA synthetase
LKVSTADFELLSSLGDDLKFVFIVSGVMLGVASQADDVHDLEALFTVKASTHIKCERCWHYRDDVGVDPAHPTICGRCTSNLYGAGESRKAA